MKPRRQYTQEFKNQAVELANAGKSVVELAAELGVGADLIYTWKRKAAKPSKNGGEGFQASLALALGLSDVVQQNSGGIKLDAIFIDEGFGTLDSETLDTALETLSSLTGEMRAVGLISHTEQVKNLITEGFDVEVTPSGSHIHARHNIA